MNTASAILRRRMAGTLSAALTLCLLAAGCASAGLGNSTPPGSEPTASVETTGLDIETVPTAPTADLYSGQQQDAASGLVIPDGTTAGQPLEAEGTGKLRIPYSGNGSSVTYVTSAEQLPDYEELKMYDDAYFRSHALVLVTETLPSGSIDVSIAGIDINGSEATVTLSHEGPEHGAAGTADMAAWLLWAEVDAGLDCRWTVANPAMVSNGETY